MINRFSLEGVFFDLEKAFDCVNHRILTDKLEFYGIDGKFLTLIESYLTGIFKKVLIENPNINYDTSSEWKRVTNGVPQDSILGPLLFLIYINDLLKITDSDAQIVLYADDTSIIVTNHNPERL
jgi:hypothetical protein